MQCCCFCEKHFFTLYKTGLLQLRRKVWSDWWTGPSSEKRPVQRKWRRRASRKRPFSGYCQLNFSFFIRSIYFGGKRWVELVNHSPLWLALHCRDSIGFVVFCCCCSWWFQLELVDHNVQKPQIYFGSSRGHFKWVTSRHCHHWASLSGSGCAQQCVQCVCMCSECM